MAHADPMKNVRIPETLHDRAAKLVGCKVATLGISRAYARSYHGTLRSSTAAVVAALEVGLEELERRQLESKASQTA